MWNLLARADARASARPRACWILYFSEQKGRHVGLETQESSCLSLRKGSAPLASGAHKSSAAVLELRPRGRVGPRGVRTRKMVNYAWEEQTQGKL